MDAGKSLKLPDAANSLSAFTFDINRKKMVSVKQQQIHVIVEAHVKKRTNTTSSPNRLNELAGAICIGGGA